METKQQSLKMMNGGWGRNNLMNELVRGKGLAQQLKADLFAASSAEMQCLLTERILGCYEKALSMLEYRGSFAGLSVDTVNVSSIPTYRKRKTPSPRLADEVVQVVVAGSELDSPLDDGHSWRKYGQKDILGSNFPRGYYRCSNRHAQGCLATKQVQRSNSDPTIFEVVYRGRHTCIQSSRSPVRSPWQKKIGAVSKDAEENGSTPHGPTPEVPDCSMSTVPNFRSDLMIKNVDNKIDSLPCLSFTPSPMEFTNPFEDISFLDSKVMEASVPDYYLSMPVCLTPDSNLTEVVSGPASVTNSLTIDKISFDPEFSFETFYC
ncbi:hypothetical protein SAY86_000635 [Trapa natans]|uniref:WRKY domain-containing protein n=1 Tax=Trapa natans TaxID=22666 RepID=A0AAN7MNX4_TRANT|nr:hypothetical protein SAY86_000635 [Trapa natans]